MYVYIYMCVCVCMCVCVYMCIHIYMCIYTYIVYIHTSAEDCLSFSLNRCLSLKYYFIIQTKTFVSNQCKKNVTIMF